MIEIGMTHTIESTVTQDMTAAALGSGALPVFGTPFLVALMENAALLCMQPELPEGKGSVGVEIAVKHTAPTPVGMRVRVTAEVTAISENGKLVFFRIGAWDACGPIGEGTHTRAIISNERFLQRCNEKLK